MQLYNLKLALLFAFIAIGSAGCAIIGLPLEVTGDAIEETEVIVEDVEDAI